MTRLSPLEEFAKTTEDNYTSSVNDVAGYERMRPYYIFKPFWFSVRKTKDCLFSRREGWVGRRILGYSVCLRLFGVDILPSRLKQTFIKECMKDHTLPTKDIVND